MTTLKDLATEAAALAAEPYRPERLEALCGLLRALPGPELDRCLPLLGLQTLLRRAPHREHVLDILAEERLPDLSVASRAVLIKALQEGPTPRRFEEAIRDCLLATRGDHLAALKRMLDAGSSYRDLVQLLYHDIDVRSIREEILAHFDSEARRVTRRHLKILSDVDDTLYANWVDRRYPRKTVYPAVRQLYLELDRESEERPSPEGDVTFLTGRPGSRFGWFEGRYHRNFAEKGLENTVILTGTLVHQFAHPLIFERKWANFQTYRRLHMDFDFVLFGDSGQADPMFLAAAVAAHPDQVKAALVHDVVGTAPGLRERWRRKGVHFFDTYAGAALELHRRGLLTAAALGRVAAVAREQMEAVPFESEDQRAGRMAELERDLEQIARQNLPG